MPLKKSIYLGIKCSLVILNLGRISKIHFINTKPLGAPKG